MPLMELSQILTLSIPHQMPRLSHIALSVGASVVSLLSMSAIARADQPLTVVYPPDNHETTATQIFLIGSAPPDGEVTVNGEAIDRSSAGHFAPSFPLTLGENRFTLRYGNETLTLTVVRHSAEPPAPVGVSFGEGSLTPAVDVARLPNEPICFGAIAPVNADVSVAIADQTIPLLPQPSNVSLPPNSAVLTAQNEPLSIASTTVYQGCTAFNGIAGVSLVYGGNEGEGVVSGAIASNSSRTADLGYPSFQLSLNGETAQQEGTGKVEILSPAHLPVVEVTAASGTARTGPGTDYSRLTPLPPGTRAAVTGREGEWLRLDYGAWIRASETQVVPNAVPPRTLIRSVRSQTAENWTDIIFPLQVPVPVSVQQGDRTFTLTLHNTTAQTDTIFIEDDPLIERLDWQQTAPQQVQYTFNLKSAQQWGYKLRYEGTSLILSLRHPPNIATRQPLAGMRILLDPGHGGPEDLGARGPTGVPEKVVALTVTQLLRDRLIERGATVYLTRNEDIDVPLQDRVDLINQLEPALALSLHYNALPDEGDAINTAGVGMFWYNTQAHSLAVFLHDYLVETLDRPSYGVFWNNLALTRPTVAPAVLLELGFMINPTEFEWIVDPQAQTQLADALADGIEQWAEQTQR
jgi:N-acetylmuramoyl-L-alanine amidase